MNFITSFFNRDQKVLIKWKLYQSRFDNLCSLHSHTASLTSDSKNEAIKPLFSNSDIWLNRTPSNFGLHIIVSQNLFSKKGDTSCLTLPGSSTHVPSIQSFFNEPLLLHHLRQEWKYLDFLSSSDNHLTLAFCLISESLHLFTFHHSSCTSIFLFLSSSLRDLLSSSDSNSLISSCYWFFFLLRSPKCYAFHVFKPFYQCLEPNLVNFKLAKSL